MVVLAVTWIANVGREAETARLFTELAIESRKEPGCVMFLVHQQKSDPARFLIYEQFRDDAALDAHRASPHFLQYVRQDLIKAAVRVEGNLYSEL